MEIIETQHAFLTPYEVYQVIKDRTNAAKPYKDGRDFELLGDYNRVYTARLRCVETLIANSPEGMIDDFDNEEDDEIGNRIAEFSNEIAELLPKINPHQIRNLIAVRPKNNMELCSIFPTEDDWNMVADKCNEIFELVNRNFPIPKEDK